MSDAAMQPCIGVTTALEGDEQRLHLAYVQAIARAGGLPLPVPMLETPERLAPFMDLLDGLVVIGGPAVTEGLIGTCPADLGPIAPLRARTDAWLIDEALRRRLPLLGICYGMQLLNARLGGTLYADAERQVPRALVHSAGRGGVPHPVRFMAGSYLRGVVGADELEVGTHHIQAIATAGRGLRVAATAPDGIIEAVESGDGQVIGLQFHPERLGDAGLVFFQDLVQKAGRREPEGPSAGL